MPERMGLDIEEPRFLKFLQLSPAHGIRSVGNGGRVNEKGHRNLVFLTRGSMSV